MKKEYNLIVVEKMKFNNEKNNSKFNHGTDVIVKEKAKEKRSNKKIGKIEENKPLLKVKESNNYKLNGEDARPDSPGIDLSVFAPRGKRKCVLQNEAKKQKTDWWSDEDEHDNEDDDGGGGGGGAHDEEMEEEIPDDFTADDLLEDKNKPTVEKYETTKKIVRKRKHRKKTTPKETTKTPENEKSPPETVQCYVFSTGMANRAGYSVSKGRYKTITEYHHAQSWETPYLNYEIHCQPFHQEFEKDEPIKDLAGSFNALPQKANEIKSENIKVENCNLESIKTEETSDTGNKLNKEKSIQATEQISKPGQEHKSKKDKSKKSITNVKEEASVVKMESISSQILNNVKEESLPTEKTIKYSTVSEIVNTPDIETSKKQTNNSQQKHPTVVSSSPPKTTTSYDSLTKSSTSYPADITNLKEQLHYNSPKPHHHTPVHTDQPEYHLKTSSITENQVRPTVLSMVSSEHRANVGSVEPTLVRSSLDLAEQELKESRTVYKPGMPILPRDIHPSLFLSRSSPRGSAFNGKLSTTSIPAFPPSSRAPGFSSVHELQTRHLPPTHPAHMNLFRHSLHGRPDLHEFESVSDKYKNLPSSFSVYHALNSRPSSLPVMPTSKRPESHPSKSFSVESLTNHGNNREKHSPHTQIPSSTGPERPPIMPEHLREYLAAPDRIHVPTNGINIHNGLKRSLDEQLSNHIMERVKRDKSYIDPLSNERYLHEKERLLYDKERYLAQHARLPFPPPHDPRSPMRIPPGYLPTRPTLTNGVEQTEKLSTSTHSFPPGYPHHIPRSHPYPYPNR